LVPTKGKERLTLQLQNVVYTQFSSALERIANFEAGSINDFTKLLQRKLDAKQTRIPDYDNSVEAE